eukprot:CAMPEP_0174894440 /NCGR_PEP_ID=MMETSP0167-20121228/9077_1 /TAXON_ID=38298 /ORGANISM="Rhodella maculata, Strain CCMP736" /LENGTH=169 /DNA_ID=CAMNT_0016133525 /DNA_START=35 /DNA_END=545 /DNA_ORIENTATION=-
MAGSGDGVLDSAPAAGDVAPVDLVSDDADKDDVLDLEAANADEVVADRIKRFIEAKNFPSSINGAELKNLKKTTSFLNECGIRLLDNQGCEYFNACWTKRSSLKAGLVEVNMFLKINKHLVPTNPEKVSRLDKDWASCIPKRPAMNDNEDEGVPDKDDDDDEEGLEVYP